MCKNRPPTLQVIRQSLFLLCRSQDRVSASAAGRVVSERPRGGPQGAGGALETASMPGPQTAVPLLHRSWANAARIPIFSVSQERGHPRAVTGISSTVKHLSMKAGPRASGIAVKSDLTRKSCCWDNLFSRTGSNGHRQARLIALRKRKKTLESTEDKTCHTTASRKMSFLSAMGAKEPQACRNVLPPQEENTAPKPGLLGRPHLVRSSSLPEVETGGVRLESGLGVEGGDD